MTNTYYTYMWLREDGTPYYIGKGHSNYLHGRGRAFRRTSPPEERILIQEFPDEQSAFVAERFFIAYYGRKDVGTGILRNRADGGEGMANPSQSTRRKLASSKLGTLLSG